MNNGSENQASYSAITSGVATVGGTAAQLPASSPGLVVFRAATANSGTVTIGGSGVTSLGGFTLAAGQQSPPLPVDNLNQFYAIASTADQKLEYLLLY